MISMARIIIHTSVSKWKKARGYLVLQCSDFIDGISMVGILNPVFTADGITSHAGFVKWIVLSRVQGFRLQRTHAHLSDIVHKEQQKAYACTSQPRG